MEFGFAHSALQAQQESIVRVRRIVQSILVAKQCPKDGAQFEQLMPVLAGSGETAHLDSKDQADVVEPNFRQQPLKPEATFGSAAALALVFIDYQYAISGPAAINGAVHQ